MISSEQIDRDRRWLSRNRDRVMALLRRLDGDVCLWCRQDHQGPWIPCDGDPRVQTRKVADLHIDHIRPMSRGGETYIDNLALLHKECNLAKGDLRQRTFEERVRRHREERQGAGWDDNLNANGWAIVAWLRMWPYG